MVKTIPRIAGLLLAVVLLVPPAQGQDGPRRIVSLNLCSDELVLKLADRADIASVSYLAADPDYAPFSGLAQGLPLNRGRAEEVIALEPDLILTSRFSATMAVSLLRRLDHEVTVLDFPATLAETYEQIMRVARLVGHPARGERLVEDMRRDIDAARARIPGRQQDTLAVFYASNGVSYGAGTLRDSFLASLGWRNLAAEAGITGPGRLDLETLLVNRPDFLLVNSLEFKSDRLAHPMLKHPALDRILDDSAILALPDRLFTCAGPSLVQAYRHIADQLEDARD